MIHVAASRVFKRPKRPSAVDKAVGAVNINFPFSMQGQNRAEKVSSKALDRYSALLLARILREVDIIICRDTCCDEMDFFLLLCKQQIHTASFVTRKNRPLQKLGSALVVCSKGELKYES